MPLKRTPDAILRFPRTVDFRYVRTALLTVVQTTRLALVADLPSERLDGHDSPDDALIMAQPDPECPDEGLMSVIERRDIPSSTPVHATDAVLMQALTALLVPTVPTQQG